MKAMPQRHQIHDIDLRLSYIQDGEKVVVSGPLSTLQWEHASVYGDTIEHTLTFTSPCLNMEVGEKRAVREVLITAEIEASGSTVAALEEAREAVGAPPDALLQIDRWSYKEAIEVSANDPVKVRFSWREQR